MSGDRWLVVIFSKENGLLGCRSGGSGCLGSRIWALDLVALRTSLMLRADFDEFGGMNSRKL